MLTSNDKNFAYGGVNLMENQGPKIGAFGLYLSTTWLLKSFYTLSNSPNRSQPVRFDLFFEC